MRIPTPGPSSQRPPLPTKWLGAASALVVVMVPVLVRLPFLWLPLSPDEAGYALGAQWWARGDVLYSADLWFDRPQGIFVAYRTGMALLGEGGSAVRTWGALWAAGGALAVWAGTLELTGSRPTALLAGALVGASSASFFIEGFTANAESFMVPTVSLGALLLWRRDFVWVGLLTGIAILLKPSGFALGVMGAAWLICTRCPVRAWVELTAAAAAPLLVATLHGWATVGLATYLEAAVWFRITHPIPDQLLQAGFGLRLSAPLLLPLSAMAAPGIILLPTRERLFSVVWIISALLGVASGGNWFPHYFQQLVPPLGIPAAVALWRAIDRGRPALRVLAVTLGALLISEPVLLQQTLRSDGATVDRATPATSSQVAAHIRERSDPDARIYVAFSDPLVNFLAQRRSAVPWLYPHPLDEVDGAFEALLAAIRNGVPEFVAVMEVSPTHHTSDSDFHAALQERYVLDAEFGGTRVYRRAR